MAQRARLRFRVGGTRLRGACVQGVLVAVVVGFAGCGQQGDRGGLSDDSGVPSFTFSDASLSTDQGTSEAADAANAPSPDSDVMPDAATAVFDSSSHSPADATTEAPVFACTGAIPSHTTLCPSDGMGLTTNTSVELTTACTSLRKCEYVCAAGYAYSSGVCEKKRTSVVFILSGQSNMWGKTQVNTTILGSLVTPPSNVSFNFAEAADNVLVRSSNIVAQGHFGPEITLMQRLGQKYPQSNVIVVKFAVPGTTIHHWNPNFDSVRGFVHQLDPAGIEPASYERLYEKLLGHVATAVRGVDDVQYGGMFWLQGESDAIHTNYEYANLLSNFVQAVRRGLGAPSMPFILGKVHGGQGTCAWADSETLSKLAYIRYEQLRMPYLLSDVGVIDTAGLSCGDDGMHFNEGSQVQLGQLFFEGFSSVGPPPPATQLIPIHRHYHPSTKDHMVSYSSDAGLSQGYVAEGVWFKTLLVAIPGKTQELFRCSSGQDHFVSVDPGCEGFTREFNIGHVYKAQAPGTVPLFRCWNSTLNDHLTHDVSSECLDHGYVVEMGGQPVGWTPQ